MGAAGLMAAIWAGRMAQASGRRLRIVGLDGATRLGAKILVAGGGRCNVTHHAVSERDYGGSSRNAIKKVLRSFDVGPTVEFFREIGVTLKREETGKLFPTTDDAHTVLDALLLAAEHAGVEIRHPARVMGIGRGGDGDGNSGFVVSGPWGSLEAARVIVATGGMALPKTGSDGAGYAMVRALGHTVTPAVFPALVPLKLEPEHFLTKLSGLAAVATVLVRASSGKHLESFTAPVLCTHFGLSGPAILDVSRHLTAARLSDPGAVLVLNWLPHCSAEELDATLLGAGKTGVGRVVALIAAAARTEASNAALLAEETSEQANGSAHNAAHIPTHQPAHLPTRLIEALCEHAGVHAGRSASTLTRDQRRAVVAAFTGLAVPVTTDRGFLFAEATAGGVPLAEVHLDTMESRVCPGLHLCGEVCDVDGRVGGFNFQWAWASGRAAGRASAKVLGPES